MLSLFVLFFVTACEEDPPVNSEVALDDITSDEIEVTLNPSGKSPLAARAELTTSEPARVSVEVMGQEPVQHSFETFREQHQVPILGLYPDTLNTVKLTFTTKAGNIAETEVQVTTNPIPSFFPTVEITTKSSLSQEGWTLAGFSQGQGSSFESFPFIFDKNGTIRWFLDLSSLGQISSFPIKQLENGNMLFSNGDNILEYNMLGEEIHSIKLNGYNQHHETVVKPNGNLIVAVDKKSLNTIEDHIIEITRGGAIVNEWDMREILDVDRSNLIQGSRDWFHMNAIWYSKNDDCLIVSGRNQGLVKVTNDNKLKWILAPHQGWGRAGVDGNGHQTSDFLLEAVDATGTPFPKDIQEGKKTQSDFEWAWGQHAPMILPNGNIFLFDNGFNRNFQQPGPNSYSRGVEYRIDEENMTVEQIWQYGKQRGGEIFAPIISDVDQLPNTNRLITSGITFDPNDPRATIMEVSFPDKSLVYEAVLHFKNASSSGTQQFGDLDICYRGERLHIYGSE